MRPTFALCLGFLHLGLCSAIFAQPIPKLPQVLKQVQNHVKDFEFSLPDFICDERITSRELLGSKVNHEVVVDSDFRGTQHSDEKDEPFTESREIKTIDGRQAKDQKLNVPFFFGGGFSSILDAIFSAKNSQYYDYKLIGTENVEEKAALVIKFATKKGQKELKYREMLGTQSVLKGAGKAWIDPDSMNVMRLELQYLDPPFPEGVLTASVDYAEVVINGKQFWMPRTVRAEQTVPNRKLPVSGQYIAEYSNYHQFKVSVHIQY